MGIYKHKQGTYKAYRVARNVGGVLRQKYFPMTKDGLKKAETYDHDLSLFQAGARDKFDDKLKARWKPDPKLLKELGRRKGEALRSRMHDDVLVMSGRTQKEIK